MKQNKTEEREDVDTNDEKYYRRKASSAIWPTLQDDIMNAVFSYLKCRDVGKASMTCKEWNSILNSDVVQSNKKLTEEIRWAKYAGGYLQPKPILHMDGRELKIHVLCNGRIIVVHTIMPDVISNGIDGHTRNTKGFLELYSVEGDSIYKVSSVETCPDNVWWITSNKDNIVLQRYNGNIEFWVINDESTLEKKTTIENAERSIHVHYALSQEGKLLKRSNTRIEILDPLQDDNSTNDNSNIVDVFVRDSGPEGPLVCWGSRLFFSRRKWIQIWSTTNKCQLKMIRVPESYNKTIMVKLSVEKINNKNRLVSIHHNGLLSQLRIVSIFSLENERLLYVNRRMDFEDLAFSPSGNCIVEFGIIRAFPTTSQIKVWKTDHSSKGNQIGLSLLESFDYQDDGLHNGICTMAFLPNGRLLSCGHPPNANTMHMW